MITNPDKMFERQELEGLINEVLITISPLEEQVLRLMFYDGLKRTQIAKELGKTPPKIKRVVEKALRKLRHPSRSRRIRDYWGDGRDFCL